MVAFWIAGAITGVIVLISLVYALRFTWPLTDGERRLSAWPHVRAGLIGGLLFTSSPFWLLLWPVVGRWHQFLPSGIFEVFFPFLGPLRFQFSWLPNFVIGYALFGFFWQRRLEKRDLANLPVNADAAKARRSLP